jgi:hypothetical protein
MSYDGLWAQLSPGSYRQVQRRLGGPHAVSDEQTATATLVNSCRASSKLGRFTL